MSKELIRETWEALSLMKNEGVDSKGNNNKPKKEIKGIKKENKKQELVILIMLRNTFL